jgi:hypothetical protein
MAQELTARALRASQNINIYPQIILEIEGLPIFGGVSVKKVAKYGEDGIYYGMPGLVYGGLVEMEDSSPRISLENTTTQFSQQLEPDKAASASSGTFKVQLIDKNGEMSRYFSPGVYLDEPLYSDATIYIGFSDTAFPDDYVRIVQGVIDSVSFGPGHVIVGVSSSEGIKRQKIFQTIAGALNGGIDDDDTTIILENTTGMLIPSDVLSCYIKVDDEIIKYADISGNNLTGCDRGQLNTEPASHDTAAETTTIYRLTDETIDLALKVMLSGSDEYYQDDIDIDSVGLGVDGEVSNAFFFPKYYDIASQLGLTVGDFITVTGAVNGANNVTMSEILEIGQTSVGSYVVVDDALVNETAMSAKASVASRFNVLPDGLGMTPKFVDVARHIELQDLFAGAFFDCDIYLKETIEGKDLINKEIYFPSGLYPVPRNARASVAYIAPPFASQDFKELNSSSVMNPEKLSIERSVGKFFYNAIVWKYEESAYSDKFLRGLIYYSADSLERIKIGKATAASRPLEITAKALRDYGDNETKINSISKRMIDRYKYAAQTVKGVRTNFATGFNIDVGDVVLFGDGLKVTDVGRGDREFEARLMEVINKSLNIKGEITLDLLDTAFSMDGRYSTVSPASTIASGATTTLLPLQTGQFSPALGEVTKWEKYIGESVVVHSADWAQEYNTTITGISGSKPNTLIVEALAGAPSSGWGVQLSDYEYQSAKIKALHGFFDPMATIISAASDLVVTVDPGQGSLFFEGAICEVNSPTWGEISPQVVVDSVATNVITFKTSLGFTPTNGYQISRIGFSSDNGLAYLLI